MMRAMHIPILCAMFLAGTADAADEPFPFVVSYDAPQNVTNVSAWLDRPAGRHGFVGTKDGHLVTAAEPIRFWATNLCFEACFPSHEQAERVAARLARLGINCVRMHHMDSYSIWGNSPNKTIIDPKKLERLDYLIYQLKLHGVYTDLNLHVSRWLDEKEGFTARQQRPEYDKGLDNFEPRMIDLQKKYARDLLTHVNPYTKTAYTDEPAIALVEINNENALFAQWGWGQLDNLPEPYAATFRKLWNAWLRKKYGSTQKLREAWKAGEWPLGEEMLRNGDFAKPPAGTWELETDARTKVEWSVAPDGPQGHGCLRVLVLHAGEVDWRPQINQGKFAVKKGTPYTLSFSIRADQKRQISVNCKMAHDPWLGLGLDTTVAAAAEWRHVKRTFIAEVDDDNARITFTGLKPARYELADVSLRPGGVVGPAADRRVEDDGVPVLRKSELEVTRLARNDFCDFLWDTERDYWSGMYRFLKDELKIKPLVSGTQLSYSPVHVQAALDYIDAHSYWNHPSFPGRAWDSRNWTIGNVALVNSPAGTLGGLAVRRVAGMPFTVSEYNHPEPIVYAAEGFPMIAAFGAFQGWDAIFSFAYNHVPDFEPRRITSFFDIKSVTPKIVHMPACAAMFLRGDVAPARGTIAVPLPPGAERGRLHDTLSAWRLTAAEMALDPRLSLRHAVAMDLGTGGRSQTPLSDQALLKELGRFGADTSGVAVSDTSQIRWDVSQNGAGYFVVDTPRTKLFTGFVRGRTFELGNVKLKIGATRLDWATVSLVCIDGEGFGRPGRILVAATGWAQNQGAELRQLDGENATLGDRWGSGPVLCEGVPAEITLPVKADRVMLYPLDESGNRRNAAAAAGQDGQTLLRLGPEHKTVWYEVEVK